MLKVSSLLLNLTYMQKSAQTLSAQLNIFLCEGISIRLYLGILVFILFVAFSVK